MRTVTGMFCLSILHLLTYGAPAWAQPQWPQFHSTPDHQGAAVGNSTINAGNAADLTPIWEAPTGGGSLLLAGSRRHSQRDRICRQPRRVSAGIQRQHRDAPVGHAGQPRSGRSDVIAGSS